MATKLSALLGSSFTGTSGPAGTIEVGTVTTGAQDSSVTVINSGTERSAILDFSIPRGSSGYSGYSGFSGYSGAQFVGSSGYSGYSGYSGESATFNYILKTQNYTATSLDSIFADTSNSPFSVTLPLSPADSSIVSIIDAKGTFHYKFLTVKGNGQLIMGNASDLILNVKNASITLVYKTNIGWRIV